MRRAVLVVLVSMFLAAGIGPAHANRVRQHASALWLHDRGDKATIYIVFATHRIDARGPTTFAGVGRIPCRVERGDRSRSIICNGRVKVEDLPLDSFVVHPALEEAELNARIGGRPTKVRWTADDRPPGVAPALPVPENPRMWIEMERRVNAAGRVLGKRVRPRTDLDGAELLQGAGAGAELPGRAGHHPVTVELRIPRGADPARYLHL